MPHFILEHGNYFVHQSFGGNMITALKHHMKILKAILLREWGHWALGAIGQILANTGPQGVVLAKGGQD